MKQYEQVRIVLFFLQIYDEKWFKKCPEVAYGYFDKEDDWLSVKSNLKKEKKALVYVSIVE